MYSVVTTPPEDEPLSLTTVKSQLNIDAAYAADDLLLAIYIKAAREWMEKRLGQSLITQSRKQYMDKFPCQNLEILYGPIQLDEEGEPVEFAVKYFDSNDVEQTWASSNYWLSTTRNIPKLVPKYSWPSAGERPDAIWVEYTAGYGDEDTDVPANIRDAMLLIVSNMYTYRVPEIEGKIISRIEMGVERLIASDVKLQYTGHGTRY